MKDILLKEVGRFEQARRMPWEDKAVYGAYLAQTFYYVAHSTRLLACAAARLPKEREKLHQRFLKHAAEERSHHLLAEHDIEALGFKLADFEESPHTQAMYETQYYRIEHVGPTVLFGYILALEANAVIHGGWLYDRVRAAHGEAAGAFLKLHAYEDPDHLDKALAMVAELAGDERTQVVENLRFSCTMYGALLTDVASHAASAGASV